jgi:uncharacterized membrane protein YGL010W
MIELFGLLIGFVFGWIVAEIAHHIFEADHPRFL